MMNKLDKNTFSGYLALCGCIIEPNVYACIDIESCENKIYEISDPRLKKKLEFGYRLSAISNYKNNTYRGSIVAAYKMLVLLEYQEDIDLC